MRARHPTTSRLAWGSCLASACLVVLAAIFLGLDSFRTSLFYGWEEALGITFPLLGALIAARRPENRIGWLMCAIGLMVAVNLAVGEYTAWALGSRLHPPAVQWVGWINEWVWIPPFGAVLTLLLLLFPDGRLLSARWRVVAIAAIPAILTVALGQALRPGRLADFPTLTNPVTGSGSPALSEALSLAGGVVLLCCVIASLAALFQPLRRRVQAVVDRRFNRARYDAGRTIDSFSARLREQVDLTSVQADLLGVVQVTMQPTAARLWLRTNEQVVR